MRVTDVIRGILDLLDKEVEPTNTRPVLTVQIEPEDELDRLKHVAGVADDEVVYANEPSEQYQGVDTIIAQGTDINRPKHPADIRTNAPSMYPGFQAGMK